MLRSTANKIGQFLGQPWSGIPIEVLTDRRDDFAHYLTVGKYQKNSKRSYLNYVRILVEEARKLGWTPAHTGIPDAWTGVPGVGPKPKHLALVRFLVGRGLSPTDVREEDLAAWIKLKVDRGSSFRAGAHETTWLRRTLVRSGIDHKLDCKKARKPNKGIPLRNFPTSLREEVEQLLAWRVRDRVAGRSANSQVRPVTAKTLEGTFCTLLGFAVNVAGRTDIHTIKDLVTEEITSDYIDWLLEVREVQSKSIHTALTSLSASLKQHPKYKQFDFKWFKELVDSLPEDDEEEVMSRKERKYLSYDVLAKIPGTIRAGRSAATKQGKKL